MPISALTGIFKARLHRSFSTLRQLFDDPSDTVLLILEKSGNSRQMSFIIFSDFEMNCVLFAKMDQVFS